MSEKYPTRLPFRIALYVDVSLADDDLAPSSRVVPCFDVSLPLHSSATTVLIFPYLRPLTLTLRSVQRSHALTVRYSCTTIFVMLDFCMYLGSLGVSLNISAIMVFAETF